MRNLTVVDRNRYDNRTEITFRLEMPQLRQGRARVPAKCSVYRDYHKAGDGILWAMQHSACIASSYSAEEIAERNRLNAEPALQNGEIVTIEGRTYRVRVLGDYSNAALFDAVSL
jgi:hypothetical protein